MSIGENIVSIRKRKGIKQRQLAEAVGVSPVSMNRWEKGKPMSAEYLRKIAIALDVSADDILGLEPKNGEVYAYREIEAIVMGRNVK